MEVHHHKSHHSPKGWKAYFSEFFMLFLAVFFGFLAENIREHYIEKDREHEYVHSMMNDLTKDTLQLRKIIKANQKVIKGIDTLLSYIRVDLPDSQVVKMYKYSGYISGSLLFNNASGTLTQLKNAGGFRLLKDTATVNEITDYDQLSDFVKKQGDAYYNQNIDLLHLQNELYDYSVLKKIQQKEVSIKDAKLYLNRNPEKIRLFYNQCFLYQQIIAGYINIMQGEQESAKKLIGTIQKQYHFKA